MDKYLREKADSYVIPLKHLVVFPCSFVKIVDGKAIECGEYKPFVLKSGDSVILRFPWHLVGYIGYSLVSRGRIADSPTVLKFIPGEYLPEITCSQEEYKGALSNGWLQREERASVFLPESERLIGRFAFAYLKIERVDNGQFPVEITELYCDSVSASSMEMLKPLNTESERLQGIYTFCARSLLNCSHDVIEDAPKRDRHLGLNEFRISALVDSATFNNKALIKRCLYLFAAHKLDDRIVASCVYQNSPPYIDTFFYLIDLSLEFVAALNDYDEIYGEREVLDDLYPTAKEQIFVAKEWFDGKKDPRAGFWIDWMPELDKSTADRGLYLYVLHKAKRLAEKKNDKVFINLIDAEIATSSEKLLTYFDKKQNLFSSETGQISVISQVYGILSGVLSKEKSSAVLDSIAACGDKAVQLHTPNVYNYYLEAMYQSDRTDLMLRLIEAVWGRLIDEGEYCCPEYIPWVKSPSPYKNPVMDSVCHASGASPAYWLQKLFSQS